MVHASLWATVVLWILIDPLAKQAWVATLRSVATLEIAATLSQFGAARCIGMALLFAIGGCALVWEVGHSLFCKSSVLTIRRMLLQTAMVAAWSALVFNSEQIEWQGKRLRATGRIDALERLAARLAAGWPDDAGEIDGLGPFTAYPFGEPRLLLLLTPSPFAATDTVITAIERSDDGSLRFQLGGDDGGDWIEWHPTGAQPENFVGGLEDAYRLKQSATLGGSWYLVRYSQE